MKGKKPKPNLAVRIMSPSEYKSARQKVLDKLSHRVSKKGHPLTVSIVQGKKKPKFKLQDSAMPGKKMFSPTPSEMKKNLSGLTTEGFSMIFPVYDGAVSIDQWLGGELPSVAADYISASGVKEVLNNHELLPLNDDRLLLCVAHESGTICPPDHYYFGKTVPEIDESDIEDANDEDDAALDKFRWWNTSDNRIYKVTDCDLTKFAGKMLTWEVMSEPDVPQILTNPKTRTAIAIIFEQGMSTLDYVECDMSKVPDMWQISKAIVAEKKARDQYREFMDSLPE